MEKQPFLIFIVDDNKMYLQVLEQILPHELNDHYLKIETYTTGEDCIAKLNHNPDLIILDYKLSNKFDDTLNGLETMREIFAINPEQNIIMLSAQENVEEAINCMKEGAIDYIVKNESAFKKLIDFLKNAAKESSVQPH